MAGRCCPAGIAWQVKPGSRLGVLSAHFMAVLLRNTFNAWIDRAPGAPPKLIMIGDVRVPTNGWHARLTKRSPQGINPKTWRRRRHPVCREFQAAEYDRKIASGRDAVGIVYDACWRQHWQRHSLRSGRADVYRRLQEAQRACD